MMDGRVKTLHPALHGGILARRDRPDDLAGRQAQGIGLVDRRRRQSVSVREGGGESGRRRSRRWSRRSTSAGRRWCAPPPRTSAACWSSSIRPTIRGCSTALDEGPTPRVSLRADAEGDRAHRAYDTAIAATLPAVDVDGERFERSRRPPPRRRADASSLQLEKIRDLRYGENPHQTAALVSRRSSGASGARPGFGARADPPGQGAVVHEPARSRRRRADRARVRRAGRGRHQAHQPVRRGHRRVGRRRLCPRARSRQPRGVRRHRRAEPAARRRRPPRRSSRRSSRR